MSEVQQETEIEITDEQRNASLLEGFNTAMGIETPKGEDERAVEQPPETPVDPAQDAPAAGEEEAPAAGELAPPPPPKAEVDPAEKRMRNLEGKFGTVNRDLQKISQQLAELATARAGAPVPSAAELAAPASVEKTAYLKREYPEFSEALDEQMAVLKAQIPDSKAFQKVAEDQAVEAGRVMRELARIDRAAERFSESGAWESDDWQETIYSDDFKTWLSEQDDAMKAKRESDYGRDVVAVLDAFEKSRKTPAAPAPTPPRGQRLEDSVPATTGSGPTRTERVQTVEEAMMQGYKRARGEL